MSQHNGRIKIGLGDDEKEVRSKSDSPRNQESKSSALFWNIMAFIMVGITLLYVSDSLQMKRVTNDGTHHGELFAEDVVYKEHSLEDMTSNSIDNLTPTTTAAPLEPVQEPVTSSSTTAITENNSTDQEQATSSSNIETNSIGYRFPPTISVTSHGDAQYYTYAPRGRITTNIDNDENEQNASIEKWGSWTLTEQRRPILEHDFYAKYRNRDVPRKDFPSTAWQKDKTYLSQFLPEGIALVKRAQEAILAEYGQPSSSSSLSWEERAIMFQITMHPEDLEDVTLTGRKGKYDPGDNGGWTTPESWKGLKQRILHAIMTEDSFVFAMGGHSSAAGHGNHFTQSYALQVQWILEPIFARLGVRHQSRNFGNGGLGTAHNGIAAGSIYGPDVDVLMWDAGMTEGEEKAQDLMHRQGLLGGIKVPMLWTKAANSAVFFHQIAGVHVGGPGTGRAGIIKRQNNLTEIENDIPWAVRYMDCDGEIKSICQDHEYDSVCWIDRQDVTPATKQKDYPGGRAGWHPGNRVHQLQGRLLAFTFLQALKETLTTWYETKDYEIADNMWHMTSHYENVRKKIYEHINEGRCHDYEKNGVSKICTLPMKARTEFTPRAYASVTNVRSLMPPEMLRHMDPVPSSMYNPPDVFNPSLHPPKGAVDVLSIVEAGSPFQPVLVPDYITEFYKRPKFEKSPKVSVGKGVSVGTLAGDDYCDGTIDSWCNRGKNQECLLSGHNDGRNGILFDGYSGWVVMNVPDVKNGFIMVKVETWYPEGAQGKTKGWDSINNDGETTHRMLREANVTTNWNMTSNTSFSLTSSIDGIDSGVAGRSLKRKKKPKPFCDDFRLEYAIDGDIKFLDLKEFQALDAKGAIQRVVELFVLLDDPDYTKGDEQEVEVAIRITGCGRVKTFNLNHVYWS